MEENSSRDVGDSRVLGCTIDGTGGILIGEAYQITPLPFYLTPSQHPRGSARSRETFCRMSGTKFIAFSFGQ